MIKKLTILLIFAYISVVLWYNLKPNDVWHIIENKQFITTDDLQKAQDDLDTVPHLEFDEKVEQIKNATDKIIVPSNFEIDSYKTLKDTIENDIIYLKQDILYDVTASKNSINLMTEQIEILENILDILSFENYKNVIIEYYNCIDDYNQKYDLIKTSLLV